MSTATATPTQSPLPPLAENGWYGGVAILGDPGKAVMDDGNRILRHHQRGQSIRAVARLFAPASADAERRGWLVTQPGPGGCLRKEVEEAAEAPPEEVAHV